MRFKIHPENQTAKRSEDQELMKFFEYIDWQIKTYPEFKCIHHIANERKTSWGSGMVFKKKGVRSGILDVDCPIPSGKYHSLKIEFKVRPNKLTPNQLEICKILHSLGHCVRVAWSGDEAIEIFKAYIKAYLTLRSAHPLDEPLQLHVDPPRP